MKTTTKTMLMRDAPIGARVFTLAKMDAEVRETYYTKISEDRYLHHGCIQGAEPLNPLVLSNDDRPRYINVIFSKGFEYQLIGTLPVYPIEQSCFTEFFPKGTMGGNSA